MTNPNANYTLGENPQTAPPSQQTDYTNPPARNSELPGYTPQPQGYPSQPQSYPPQQQAPQQGVHTGGDPDGKHWKPVRNYYDL